MLDLPEARLAVEEASQDVVLAYWLLQDVADYRGVLQGWFRTLRPEGHLIVVVPHAFLHERQIALPSRRRPAQRRLYTPGSLLTEVEEALTPNSYRVRWAADVDDGYDYRSDLAGAVTGRADLTLVLQRLPPPFLSLIEPDPLVPARTPRFAFEPPRTRVEHDATAPAERILLLKLDHLGDFILSIPALKRARAAFPHAEITLVVASWNASMARALDVADHVLVFDAYPRNSSEEDVDVVGKTALFEAAIVGRYDVAIDLRTDDDTRFLLRSVNARVRAGLGTKARFSFLDIFLPVDGTRHGYEAVHEEAFGHDRFAAQGFCTRNAFRIGFDRDTRRTDRGALIWGPYVPLQPGRYRYEPMIEIEDGPPGVLSCDVALDAQWVSFKDLTGPAELHFEFVVEKPGAVFEARTWALDDQPALSFSFYGGRLTRQGASSVLHQSEYLSLLIELVRMRVCEQGLLREGEAIA